MKRCSSQPRFLLRSRRGPTRRGRRGEDVPKVVTDNKNGLVKAYRDKLKVTASTFWPGWAPEKLIDGDEKTSWFSAQGDAAAKGKKP